MKLEEFSERVAHYCDESQVENVDFFLTVLNGVFCEVLERFPEVASVTVTRDENSQPTVKMLDLDDDFASFSFPPLRKNGVYLPDGCAVFDTRLGEIRFAREVTGEIEILYNRKVHRMNLDDLEDGGEIPLPNDKLELCILLAAYRLLVIDEDRKAGAIKQLYDEAAYVMENRRADVAEGYRILDGWA